MEAYSYVKGRIADLTRQKATLLLYLSVVTERCDWHGVEDTASDIRDIESGIYELNLVLERLNKL